MGGVKRPIDGPGPCLQETKLDNAISGWSTQCLLAVRI